MSELEGVIEGCRNGVESMQRALYERYSPRFYALCQRYAHNDEVAKELLMDGFLSVFKSINNYRGEGSFEGWMHIIFMRQIIKWYRKDRPFLVVSLDDSDVMQLSHEEDPLWQMDVRQALLKSLRSLSEEEQVLFNLIAVEEYSFVEVAKMYDVHVNTLKSKYYKIRDIMRKKMKKYLD